MLWGQHLALTASLQPMGGGTNPPSLGTSPGPTKQRGRAIGTPPPKAIFRCPHSQQGFWDWPQNHKSSQKPRASQFHADDGKALALGSSCHPCSEQHEDISLPGCGGPGVPCSPGTTCPGTGRAAAGPEVGKKSCPAVQVQPRAGGSGQASSCPKIRLVIFNPL